MFSVNNLNKKNILVGITGSIAAYKAADLISRLKKSGACVKVVMTKSSTSFITERTLECISENKVYVDESECHEHFLHLDLAKWADIVLIAPCTANSFNKITNALGDDLLSTICLAFNEKIFIAPAMNPDMWNNELLQKNLQNMPKSKFSVIGPDYGKHACGDEGYGRMSQPEMIVDHISSAISKNILNGLKVLVSAGPTREPIDPVRFISNYSSGKMGYAVAEAARDMGAYVELISGPVIIDPPDKIPVAYIETSSEMLEQVLNKVYDFDVYISAAAISDYKPSKLITKKHKSVDGDLHITLKKGIDILKTAKEKNPSLFTVGFSAETHDVLKYAADKLISKNIDMIIANEANHQKGLAFGSDENEVTLIQNNSTKHLPLNSKKELAKGIIEELANNLRDNLIKVKNAR